MFICKRIEKYCLPCSTLLRCTKIHIMYSRLRINLCCFCSVFCQYFMVTVISTIKSGVLRCIVSLKKWNIWPKLANICALIKLYWCKPTHQLDILKLVSGLYTVKFRTLFEPLQNNLFVFPPLLNTLELLEVILNKQL